MRFLMLSMVVVSMVFAAAGVHAEDTAKKEKILEMIKMSGAGNVLDQTARALVPQVMKQIREKAPEMNKKDQTELANLMIGEMMAAREDYFKMLVPIYDQIYTMEEVDFSLEYYKSPIGQSIIKKTPTLMQYSMQAGQQWATRVGQAVANKAVARAMEMGYKL